jgi:CheY-like chemotaxis protein
MVLVVEDHDGLRQLATKSLTQLGYKVIAAADGEQAVDQFLRHRDTINLVLLDVVLPKLNGPEIYSRIRASRPEIPAVFAAGYSADFALLQVPSKLIGARLPYSEAKNRGGPWWRGEFRWWWPLRHRSGDVQCKFALATLVPCRDTPRQTVRETER